MCAFNVWFVICLCSLVFVAFLKGYLSFWELPGRIVVSLGFILPL